MTISRSRSRRGSTTMVVALGAGVLLAACAQAGPVESAGSPSPSAQPPWPATAPDAGYDIGRIDGIKGDFPAGFTTEAHGVKTLTQHDIDTSGAAGFTGAQVDPPQCRALLIPPYAEPSVGTDAAGVRGQGDQGSVYVVAMRRPEALHPDPPPAGCDGATMSGSPRATGTVEAIPAPGIAGATTTGARLGISGQDEPDYVFTAALDDHTAVVVMGSAADELNPPQLMSDLLVKSVATVRGG